MIERIIIAGGGTGGHLFPGIAVAEELRRRKQELQVLFVGTERGIEARLLPSAGERVVFIDAAPLMGLAAAQLARSLLSLPRSLLQAVGILRSHRPQVVLGLGGYAAGPVLLAASVSRIPTALLEQNIHVGLTNRLLASTVGRAYLTYEETATRFGPARARVCGNPVRRAFVEAARMAAADPAGLEARSRTVFVLGGSQGARALNRTVPAALGKVGLASRGIRVLHQTGTAMVDEVQSIYRDAGIQAEVVPFVQDMARAYASASLVVARAGATTLAELCSIGRPSVLIPYPYAAEDHQQRNAAVLERAGAAVVIREQAMSADVLAQHVKQLLDDAGRRRAMADAARRLGKPDAAAAIVDDLCAWLGHCTQRAPGSTEDAGEGHSVAGRLSPGSKPPSPPEGNGDAARRQSKVKRRGQLRLRTVHASVNAAG